MSYCLDAESLSLQKPISQHKRFLLPKKKKKKIEYAYSLLVLCFLRSDFANLVSHIFPKAKQFLTTLLCNYLTFLYSIFPLNLQCFIENCFFC